MWQGNHFGSELAEVSMERVMRKAGDLRVRIVAIVVLLVCGFAAAASVHAQVAEQEVPVLIAGELPLYPIAARAARISGTVLIKVITDGTKVASLEVVSGPAMLVKSAEANIKTWKFLKHEPTTFVTTFEYVLEQTAYCTYTNGRQELNLPLKARITVKGIMTCDPAEVVSKPQ
jgi:hypothetical protein